MKTTSKMDGTFYFIWNMLDARVINIALRGLTLLSKFVLMFFLARYLEPTELGLYGLIVITISYAMYPLGFDFYTFNIREILSVDDVLKGKYLKGQMFLHFALYTIFIPLLFAIFIFNLLPWSCAPIFFLLLVFEHLNQELFRLLVALSKPFSASVCLFLRQGLWAIVAVLFMCLDDSTKTLSFVLNFWLVGSALSLVLSFFTLYKMPISGWSLKVDWRWIISGLKVAIPLFIATLSLNAISVIDKYWFSYLMGEEILGAYIFYMALASSLLSFLDAGVFSFIYPRLVVAKNNKDHALFVSALKDMTLQSIIFVVGYLLFSLLLIDYAISFIGGAVYESNIWVYYILLLSIAVHGLSYVMHYALYALGDDRAIICSHVLALCGFLIVGVIISLDSKLYAIPLSLLFSYTLIFILKFVRLKKSIFLIFGGV